MKFLAWLLALLVCTNAKAEALFDAHTHAVIAGVLQWEDPSFSSFSDDTRKDKALHQTLLKIGAKNNNLSLLLDEKATKKAILHALKKQIKSTKPHDNLLFYYAGHGFHLPNKDIAFAAYDTRSGGNSESALAIREIEDLVVKHFRGARLILMADCCYSGGLTKAAERLQAKGIRAMALTSASEHNVSTGSWSFTQTLLDALEGRTQLDHNRDSTITLKELAQETKTVMKFREAQMCGYFADKHSEQLTLKTNLPTTPSTHRSQDPEWVVSADEKQRGVGRVLRETANTYWVEFYNYNAYVEHEISKSQTLPLGFDKWPVGARLRVSWDESIYEAEVLETNDIFHLITYPGWGKEWDEWITSNRIHGEWSNDTKAAAFCKVEWKGKWWPAEVTHTKNDQKCITYLGYEKSWDECVPDERIRCESPTSTESPTPPSSP